MHVRLTAEYSSREDIPEGSHWEEVKSFLCFLTSICPFEQDQNHPTANRTSQQVAGQHRFHHISKMHLSWTRLPFANAVTRGGSPRSEMK